MEFIHVLYLNSAKAEYTDLTTASAIFQMKSVLDLPRDAKIKVACQSFSFTNFFINISVALANNTFFYTDDLLDPTKYSVVIPDGSYSVSDLSNAINLGVINNAHPDGLITLIPDFSSNKVIFSISLPNWQINFSAGSPYILLGTTLDQAIPALALTVGPYSEMATNVATFNDITNLYLHTSLTNSASFSGTNSDVIASIIPTASIGSIQSEKEYNLVWINADNLAGSQVSQISIYVTNQSGARVRLQDHFSCTIVIARAD